MRTAVDSTWLRAAVLALLVVAALACAFVVDLPEVGTVRGWVEQAGPWGWAGMVLGVAVVLLAPVPRSAVSALLGLVVGFPAGVAVALAGGLLGGLAAFGLARALGRPAVARLAGRRMQRVDRLLVDRGFWALLAGRLVPVVPFVALSYGAGLTAVRLGPYASATALGLVPGTVLQVGAGASAGVLATHAATHATTLAVVPGVVAVLAVALAMGLLRRRRRSAGEPA